MASSRRPASLRITPIELYNRLQVMGGLLLIDTRPKRRRRRTTVSRRISLDLDDLHSNNTVPPLNTIDFPEKRTSTQTERSTGDSNVMTSNVLENSNISTQDSDNLEQSATSGNQLSSEVFELKSSSGDDQSKSAAPGSTSAGLENKTAGDSMSARVDSFLLEKRNSQTAIVTEIIRSSICIPSRGIFIPEHTLTDKINLITESLTEADAVLFRRRKLVQAVLYSDESSHHWMLDLRDILLEEGAVLSVAIMETPFSAFQRLYPFMCVPGVSSEEKNREYGLFKIYPNEIEPGIFLGNRRQSLDDEIMLRELGFTHVIDLHDADIPAALTFQSQGVKYFTLAIWDREDADFGKAFEQIYDFVKSARASAIYHYQGTSRKTKILFHCNQGISRSSSCVIYYIMRKHHVPLTKAFQIVQNARDCVYPNSAFMKQLLHEEQKIFGTQSDISVLSVAYDKDLGKPEPYRCALM